MIEIIEFVLNNATSIVSYEIIDYSIGMSMVEFTMNNGEKIQINF